MAKTRKNRLAALHIAEQVSHNNRSLNHRRVEQPFEPDYAIHPGETLAETLDGSGMPISQLAERSGLTRKTISGIIHGREPITPDTALRLEKVFGVPARFWLNLQKNYDKTTARLQKAQATEGDP